MNEHGVKNAFDRVPEQVDFTHDDEDPSTWDRVKQEFKDDCNINKIVERFRKTGVIDHLQTYGGSYTDVTPTDLQTAINQVNTANGMFADLPSHVRARVNNDPVQFLEFVQNPANMAELVELGLAVPPAGPVVGGPPAQPGPAEAQTPAPEPATAAQAAESAQPEAAPPSPT